MASGIMTTGIYNYKNDNGTTVAIDVGKLPVTNKPSNIIIPNVYIDPDTGQLSMLITPQLWVDEATNLIYRTTTPPA